MFRSEVFLCAKMYVACCSHYIVPELGPEVTFAYSSHKAVNEYKEAKAVCVHSFELFLLLLSMSFVFRYNRLGLIEKCPLFKALNGDCHLN